MKRILVLALITLAASVCAWGQRLPNTVLPESYDLTLEPNLAKATFSGGFLRTGAVIRHRSLNAGPAKRFVGNIEQIVIAHRQILPRPVLAAFHVRDNSPE